MRQISRFFKNDGFPFQSFMKPASNGTLWKGYHNRSMITKKQKLIWIANHNHLLSLPLVSMENVSPIYLSGLEAIAFRGTYIFSPPGRCRYSPCVFKHVCKIRGEMICEYYNICQKGKTLTRIFPSVRRASLISVERSSIESNPTAEILMVFLWWETL